MVLQINGKELMFPVTETAATEHRKKVLNVYFDLKKKPHKKTDPIFYMAELQVWKENSLDRVYGSIQEFCKLMSLLKNKKKA